MKSILAALLSITMPSASRAADAVALEEKFDSSLSADWFWGLGTWSAKDGVLRGFESGPRRHGPVKMRKFPMRDGSAEFEFRLEGKATSAGIIFNGSQERGHIIHVLFAKDHIRIIAHPKKSETVDLMREPANFTSGKWHRVRVEMRGADITATVDGRTLAARNPCIAEEKQTFGLGGDSGGAEGEKAGAVEFRKLKLNPTP